MKLIFGELLILYYVVLLICMFTMDWLRNFTIRLHVSKYCNVFRTLLILLVTLSSASAAATPTYEPTLYKPKIISTDDAPGDDSVNEIHGDLSLVAIIFVPVVVVAGLCLYYAYREHLRERVKKPVDTLDMSHTIKNIVRPAIV